MKASAQAEAGLQERSAPAGTASAAAAAARVLFLAATIARAALAAGAPGHLLKMAKA